MPIHAPFWGVFGAHFPQMMSLIVLTPKRTILGRIHVIWAINRENRSRGSSWAYVREKKDMTGQDRKKVTKGLYFTYLWRSPHWSDVHENLCSGWCSRRNDICQVSKWNFQGLQFSNFPFFLLILNGLYNSAALLRCLWYSRKNATQMSRLNLKERDGERNIEVISGVARNSQCRGFRVSGGCRSWC